MKFGCVIREPGMETFAATTERGEYVGGFVFERDADAVLVELLGNP